MVITTQETIIKPSVLFFILIILVKHFLYKMVNPNGFSPRLQGYHLSP